MRSCVCVLLRALQPRGRRLYANNDANNKDKGEVEAAGQEELNPDAQCDETSRWNRGGGSTSNLVPEPQTGREHFSFPEFILCQ